MDSVTYNTAHDALQRLCLDFGVETMAEALGDIVRNLQGTGFTPSENASLDDIHFELQDIAIRLNDMNRGYSD